MHTYHLNKMSGHSNDDEMCFFELMSMEQYTNEMNTNNRFGLRQFNEPQWQRKVDVSLFDLVLVPGLVFEKESQEVGDGVGM